MRDNHILMEGCKQLSLTLTPEQQEQFEDYFDLLIERNKVMNLTAITEYEDVLTKHFLDSLSITCTGIQIPGKRVLDLGTGAGFPGIPLKIVFPDTDVVLMDALQKRVTFLEEVVEKLGLKKVTAIHARAEEAAARSEYREQFDLCVSRAVARLSTLSEYCVPFVKTGGAFVAYKSADCAEECEEARRAAAVLAGGEIKRYEWTIPGTSIARAFLVIEKKRRTDAKYPRAQGKPQKQPL